MISNTFLSPRGIARDAFRVVPSRHGDRCTYVGAAFVERLPATTRVSYEGSRLLEPCLQQLWHVVDKSEDFEARRKLCKQMPQAPPMTVPTTAPDRLIPRAVVLSIFLSKAPSSLARLFSRGRRLGKFLSPCASCRGAVTHLRRLEACYDPAGGDGRYS